jgi:Peptidase family M23
MAVPPGQAQFAAAVLQAIKAPVTPGNIAGFVGWSKAEGGSNWQRNNPLNTTEPTGATSTFNSAGVRGYPNSRAGVQATAKTLLNGDYGGIINAFRQNNPNALAPAIGSSKWGTSGQLAAQTISQTLKGGGITVPSRGGGAMTSPGLTSTTRTSSQTVPTFNQAGYDQAKSRAVAGSFVSSNSGASNPYNFGPKGADLGPNPLFTSGALTTTPPNPADFQGTKTLTTATQKLQQVAGQSLVNVHAGAQGYVNPIPGAVIGRTDMGVDANLKVGSPIRAIGDSKVVAVRPNWFQGQPYVQMQLLNGPQAGKYYYVAEQIAPTVKAGDTVKAGQTIGTYAPSGTGIEIGWGTKGSQTLAQATTGYSEGEQTAAGKSFRSFLGSLGVK